jgi:transposase
MEHHAGIDMSLEQSSVRVVDGTGRIVREAKVPSEPEALVRFLHQLGLPLARVGLGAGPLSPWLHAGSTESGLAVVLLETRHVKAALSAMAVKSDREDARGIAQLLRMGRFRPVHCKSRPTREVRALLVGRKRLQGKLLDIEQGIRGVLRGFGLKVGQIGKGRFAMRIRELAAGRPMLARVTEPMLRAREVLRAEYSALHRAMLAIARGDATCKRLMTVPGVGAVVAVTFTSAIEDPTRFGRSRAVGAHFGLTPKRYRSGEVDVTGGISRAGDGMVRAALHEAANVMLTRAGKSSTLKRWALEVAKRRGMRRAKVALARKRASILHRMRVDGSGFRFGKEAIAA